MRVIQALCSYAMAGVLVIMIVGGTARAQCVGDCNGNGSVSISELVTAVNIALGRAIVDACLAIDVNGDGEVRVSEIIRGINNALRGCPDDCGDCSDGDACTTDVCESGECVNDPVVCQDDGNECTAELCDSVSGCASNDVDDGTSCNSGAGSCQSGSCVALGCTVDGECDDGNACTDDSCASNSCVNNDVVCQDDGNECTAESCDSGTGCGSSNVDDGTSCNGDEGTCQAGVCETSSVEIEYEQDFESLDQMSGTALGEDGLRVGATVFFGSTRGGRFLYNYFSFPAPNGGAAFSAIVNGEGGPEQGDQQLSVYNDYNNQDHGPGGGTAGAPHTIEALVFRERLLDADDVGKTLTFRFDHKRGNINDPADQTCMAPNPPCASTAIAFVKTLDRAANFATIDFMIAEMTDIPATWGTSTLTLVIDEAREGLLLQIGFQNTATLFQPSAIYYDNLEVSFAPTAP